MVKLELIDQEIILRQTRPHPLAFYHLYAIWLYLIAVGLLFILYFDNFMNSFISIPIFEGSNLIVNENPNFYQALWLFILLIPSVKSRSILAYGGYLLGMYLVSLPLLGKIVGETVESTVTQSLFQGIIVEYEPGQKLYLFVWLLLIIIPGIIIALTRISLRWLSLFIAIGSTIILLRYAYSLSTYQINLLLIATGFIGVTGTEIWCRSHRYHITNFRIVTEVMGKKRVVFYSKISDLIMETNLLGRIFRFGSITPLTGSGMGVGMDIALAGAGMSKNAGGKSVGIGFGGGKTISTPRSRSSYILFGIPDQKKEYTRIIELIHRNIFYKEGSC